MRMNKFVPVLLVFVIAFAAMQLLTWSIAEAGKKYPKIRADAGDDFKASENKEVKLDGSDSRGGFKKFTDFEWELVRVNGAKVNNEPFQINNGDEKEASFMAPDVASGEVTYEFKLKVRDEVDREDDDTIKIVVMNQQASVPVGPT